MPSTCPTYPNNTPACIAPTVLRPMTGPGFLISILGNLAVRPNRASAEMPIPGEIAPPKYIPPSNTAEYVVAVPKSIIIKLPPYFS